MHLRWILRAGVLGFLLASSAIASVPVDLRVSFDDSQGLLVDAYAPAGDVHEFVATIELDGVLSIHPFPVSESFAEWEIVTGRLRLDELDPAAATHLAVEAVDARGAILGRSVREELRPEPPLSMPSHVEESRSTNSVRGGPFTLSVLEFNPGSHPLGTAFLEIDSLGTYPRADLSDSLDVREVDFFRQARGGLEVPTAAVAGIAEVDFVLVLDNTLSMIGNGSLPGSIADDLQDLIGIGLADADLQMTLVLFGPDSLGGAPIVGPVETDRTAFLNEAFAAIFDVSGTVEPGLQAIVDACEQVPFRPLARRVILLVSNEDSDAGDLEEAIACCNEKRVEVYGAVDCTAGVANIQYCGPGGIVQQTGGALDALGFFPDILGPQAEFLKSRYELAWLSDPFCGNTLTQFQLRDAPDPATLIEVSMDFCPDFPTISKVVATEAISATPQPANTDIFVCVMVEDPAPPFVNDVRVHARESFLLGMPENEFQSFPLTEMLGGMWCGNIPDSLTNGPGVDFFFSASDGEVTAFEPKRAGSNILPIYCSTAIVPNDIPQIMHVVPGPILEGMDLEITFSEMDADGILSREVLYGPDPDVPIFVEEEFTDRRAGLSLTLPAANLSTPGVHYRVRLTDLTGVSTMIGPFFVPITNGMTTVCPGTGIVGCLPSVANDTLRVPIVIENAPLDLKALGFDVSFNSSDFAYVRTDFTGHALEDFDTFGVDVLTAEVDSVRIGAFAAASVPVSNPDTLATLVFTLPVGADTGFIRVSNFVDDLETVAVCSSFVNVFDGGRGDVNDDNEITPNDAKCAFLCHMNGGILPMECMFGGNCEVNAIDVDCDGACMPADASAIQERYFCDGEPEVCFAMVGPVCPATHLADQVALRSSVAEVRFGEVVAAPGSEVAIPIEVRGGGGLRSFSMDLELPSSLTLAALGAAEATASWPGLAAAELGDFVRVAGYSSRAMELSRNEWTTVAFLRVVVSVEAHGTPTLEIVALSDGFEGAFGQPGPITLQGEALPTAFELSAPRPNPSRGAVVFSFSVPGGTRAPVSLKIYDVAGRLVRTVLDNVLGPGTHEATWDGLDGRGHRVAAGAYFYRMASADFDATRKVVITR